MKIYLSLPITGHNIDDVKKKAQSVAAMLRHKGNEVITPFDVSSDDTAPYALHMGKDIQALLECDAVYFCNGWNESKGCRLEHAAALVYEKKIFEQEVNPDLVPELNMNLLRPGNIVTYDTCPTTIAMVESVNLDKNDSGDLTYKSVWAIVEENKENVLYLGNLVVDKDIRLATEAEQRRFFAVTKDIIANQKKRINNMQCMVQRCESRVPCFEQE